MALMFNTIKTLALNYPLIRELVGSNEKFREMSQELHLFIDSIDEKRVKASQQENKQEELALLI